MNTETYPIPESLRDTLKTTDSPLYVMRIIRQIAFKLKISHTEVEILLGVAATKESTPLNDICYILSHLSEDRVKRLVKNLRNKKILNEVLPLSDGDFEYVISCKYLKIIKNIYRDSLK